ncbi:MAG: heme lyase CcmF/NrfE family subunit [Bacillota bacterium]
MVQLADVVVLAGFLACLYGGGMLVLGVRQERKSWLEQGRAAAVAGAVLCTLASGMLVYFLIVSDFRIAYVVNHTSRNLPLLYRVSAFWAGQEGSLLLWALVLSWYAAYVARVTWGRSPALSARALALMLGVEAFFLFLVGFVTSPFRVVSPVPADGMGLNPMLQNVGMLLHPVTLYLGYVGFTVPFAFALAALHAGDSAGSQPGWLHLTRSFTLWSWLFLSVGIILGMQWAYVELGWGGYWAWDPVENASLLPWLTATAFLHSALVQEKRGTMAGWNVILVVMTFFLTILGTFLTRSGVLSSVHAFAPSGLGAYFLVFMVLVLLGSAYLLVRGWSLVEETRPLESLLSRETAVIVAEFLFAAFALVVFWGTVFPLLSVAAGGKQISVGPAFYVRAAVPFGALTVVLLGICQVLGWSRSRLSGVARGLAVPAVLAALAAGALTRWQGPQRLSVGALAGFFAAFLVAFTGFAQLLRDVRARRSSTQEGWLGALAGLVERNPRRYGALLVHLAVACMVVGFSGSAFRQEATFTLQPGQSTEAVGYTITYRGLDAAHLPHRVSVYAHLEVTRDGRVTVLRPEKQYYPSYESAFSEVAVRGGLSEDLYTVLEVWQHDGTASFRVIREPLVAWIWVGGYLLVGGTLVLAWPRRLPGPTPRPAEVRSRAPSGRVGPGGRGGGRHA